MPEAEDFIPVLSKWPSVRWPPTCTCSFPKGGSRILGCHSKQMLTSLFPLAWLPACFYFLMHLCEGGVRPSPTHGDPACVLALPGMWGMQTRSLLCSALLWCFLHFLTAGHSCLFLDLLLRSGSHILSTNLGQMLLDTPITTLQNGRFRRVIRTKPKPVIMHFS